MQRIAVFACLGALVLAGCQAPAVRTSVEPIPSPILATRTPEPVRAIPPTTEVLPLPRSSTSGVTLADIRPRTGIRKGLWKTIVVHHSGSEKATPQGMDSWHHQRGWAGGLGYHFVIGNGVNYPDGKLYVGPRWWAQGTGAHCKSPAGKYFGVWHGSNFFNEQGIGICLIGNFENEQPTAKQLETLEDLICVLSRETGIGSSQVYGHREVTHKTECPGSHMNMSALRRALAADMDRPYPAVSATTSAGEARGGR